MAKTGEKCTLEGWYEGICEQLDRHQDRTKFLIGDVFLACEECGSVNNPHGTVMSWAWVRRI